MIYLYIFFIFLIYFKKIIIKIIKLPLINEFLHFHYTCNKSKSGSSIHFRRNNKPNHISIMGLLCCICGLISDGTRTDLTPSLVTIVLERASGEKSMEVIRFFQAYDHSLPCIKPVYTGYTGYTFKCLEFKGLMLMLS